MADTKSRWIKDIVNVLSKLALAAAPSCPIIVSATTFIEKILPFVDKGNLEKLEHEFGKMHDGLDKILQKTQDTLEEIQMTTIEIQFSEIDKNIVYQYNKYKEVIMAEPDNLQKKMVEFEECYENNGTDNNMRNIYNAVKGDTIFVKLDYSHVKMENLFKRLNYLFFIGFITIMGYYAAKGDDLKDRYDQWLKMMKEVQEKLQEKMRNIPAPAQPLS